MQHLRRARCRAARSIQRRKRRKMMSPLRRAFGLRPPRAYGRPMRRALPRAPQRSELPARPRQGLATLLRALRLAALPMRALAVWLPRVLTVGLEWAPTAGSTRVLVPGLAWVLAV